MDEFKFAVVLAFLGLACAMAPGEGLIPLAVICWVIASLWLVPMTIAAIRMGIKRLMRRLLEADGGGTWDGGSGKG